MRTTLDKLDSSTAESVVSDVTSKAALAQDNGVLYYTDAGKYLRKIDSTNDTLIGQLTSAETVVSLAVYSGILYYTDTAKTLYVYDLTTNEQLNSFEGGYSALSVSDGYIYAVNNDSVRQYSPADAAFTDFEICASSSSQNRLSGASDTILVGDKLLFADNGNNRISSYDTKTGERRVFRRKYKRIFLLPTERRFSRRARRKPFSMILTAEKKQLLSTALTAISQESRRYTANIIS